MVQQSLSHLKDVWFASQLSRDVCLVHVQKHDGSPVVHFLGTSNIELYRTILSMLYTIIRSRRTLSLANLHSACVPSSVELERLGQQTSLLDGFVEYTQELVDQLLDHRQLVGV